VRAPNIHVLVCVYVLHVHYLLKVVYPVVGGEFSSTSYYTYLMRAHTHHVHVHVHLL
jgi:hypothetical protein